MNWSEIARIGIVFRWLGIIILAGFLIDHFTGLTVPLVGKIKYAAVIIWLFGTVLLRYAQTQIRKSEENQ